MNPKKFRWSKVYESSEEELQELLDAQGIKATRWSADEFHDFETINFDQPTTLWCAEGSLVLVHNTKRISLQPGDGISFPAGFTATGQAGMGGCACYEATQQA